MVRQIFRSNFAHDYHVLGIIFYVLGAGPISWVHLNDIVGTMYICRGEHKITMSCVHVVGNTELPYLGYISWVHIVGIEIYVVGTYVGY